MKEYVFVYLEEYTPSGDINTSTKCIGDLKDMKFNDLLDRLLNTLSSSNYPIKFFSIPNIIILRKKIMSDFARIYASNEIHKQDYIKCINSFDYHVDESSLDTCMKIYFVPEDLLSDMLIYRVGKDMENFK